jgi:DNA-binding NarL/FixJ family response regulator
VLYRLLGPVEVWDGDRRVDLGRAESAKARCVLAALLRDPGGLVTSDTLAERVWGDNPPGATVRYKYIGWLRAALAPYGVQLVFRDNGYVIPVDPDQVDLHRSRRLVVQARNEAGAGRYEVATAALRDALALWRGPPLAGLSGRWAELFRDQLAEERVAAAVLRARAEMELGRHTEVVPELAELHTERPTDETVAGLLMLALYRDGQRAQALACYRRAEQHIHEMLDTEPGPELRDLRRRIQTGDPSLMPSRLIIDAAVNEPVTAPVTQEHAIRVVIAEDTAILRDSIAWLLSTRGHQVAASVGDAEALKAAVDQHEPDVVIVDVRLSPPDADEGFRTAAALRRGHPGLGVLVLSEYIQTRFAAELLAGPGGGVGYLLKHRVANVGEFIDALIRVARGGTALDPGVVSRLLATSGHGDLAALTEGERDVVKLMAQGRSSTTIAHLLAISVSAVDKYVRSAFQKLGLSLSADDDSRARTLLRYLCR